MENILYCLHQAHYLYKIADYSFILKPKYVAAILWRKWFLSAIRHFYL